MAIKHMNTNRLIALTFCLIILTGTGLLMLPMSSASSQPLGFLTCLFTATSATCVTGLSIVDISNTFSLTGQIIILLLIQIGGLGFMAIISVFIMLSRKKADITQTQVLAQSIGSESLKDIQSLQFRLLAFSLTVELIGSLVLTLRFMADNSLPHALWLGLFHSISAFCNAGFDLFSTSLLSYQTDPTVILTVSLLLIIGGIGFLVWDEILSKKSLRKCSVYVKLVLLTSTVLLVLGAFLFLILEAGNEQTIAGMGIGDRILVCFFQSATTRTAGFASVDQGLLTEGSRLLSMLLMFIGGSSGSTSGGVKTVTFIVALKYLISRAAGRKQTNLMGRRVSSKQISDALTITGTMLCLVFFGSTLLCALNDITISQSLFETVSAIATVGLSTGITANLSTLSHVILVLFMFIGRVGILTICIGFFQEKPDDLFSYPKTVLLIG